MEDYIKDEELQGRLSKSSSSQSGREKFKHFLHTVVLTRDKTPHQEQLFQISQLHETIPIIRIVLLCLAGLILITWPTDYLYFEEDMINIYFIWRLVMLLSITVLLGLMQFSRWVQNNIYNFTFVGVLGAIFFTAYLFGQEKDLSTPWFYIIFILPVLTVFFNSKILWRTIATIIVPIIYAAGFLLFNPQNLDYEYLGLTFNLVLSSIIISILLGHIIFYLNRQSFFQQRQLKQQQEEIQKLADYDQLTGIFNRREFENRAKSEFLRSLRYNCSLSLLMMDLDHFKNINDTHGHFIGDTVLKKLGESIEACSRATDIAGRYGGEEFSMILPETSSQGAIQMAERLRKRLEKIPFENEAGEKFHVTCSIGIAEWNPEIKSYEQLIKKADEALYLAKAAGRNQIKLAES